MIITRGILIAGLAVSSSPKFPSHSIPPHPVQRRRLVFQTGHSMIPHQETLASPGRGSSPVAIWGFEGIHLDLLRFADGRDSRSRTNGNSAADDFGGERNGDRDIARDLASNKIAYNATKFRECEG